jgi:phosphohistidine phosphatase SixA
MDLGIDMIFSSPLTRCQQTASIVEESLGLHTKTVDVLSPDADPAQLCVMLAQHDTKSILLVGHEPNISEFISKVPVTESY